ncbi:hypothetical protein ACO0LF_27160 [Undibacterium sp. Di27W]|uniref:hypothetical protein n=1 Tax=Undibacterium sp. Di27W TaxID=3413036 RepID=UPI003BF00ABB
MKPEDIELLNKRKDGLDEFYEGLIPTLVEFVGLMGIQPAHEVLKNAGMFANYLDSALQNMVIADNDDRTWLMLRVGQFIGEYFVQKYSGCWYVNDIENSRYFARYVVGKFASLKNMNPMLDPFQIAQTFVDSPAPRKLEDLLNEVDAELLHMSQAEK